MVHNFDEIRLENSVTLKTPNFNLVMDLMLGRLLKSHFRAYGTLQNSFNFT